MLNCAHWEQKMQKAYDFYLFNKDTITVTYVVHGCPIANSKGHYSERSLFRKSLFRTWTRARSWARSRSRKLAWPPARHQKRQRTGTWPWIRARQRTRTLTYSHKHGNAHWHWHGHWHAWSCMDSLDTSTKNVGYTRAVKRSNNFIRSRSWPRTQTRTLGVTWTTTETDTVADTVTNTNSVTDMHELEHGHARTLTWPQARTLIDTVTIFIRKVAL